MPTKHSPARSGTRVVRLAALSVLLISACSVASGEPERSADPAAPASDETIVPPATAGELQARVEGLGEEQTSAPDDLLLIGDSVLVLVADDLARRLSSTVYVDAADCRRIDMAVSGSCGGVPAGATVTDGISAIETNMVALASVGTVPDVAVIVLANNSSLRRSDLDAAMRALEPVERVWWVNTRIDGFGRQDPNNRLLDELARDDDRAMVVDWYEASEDKDWLADHVHPNDAGQRAMAALIARHISCDCIP